MAIPIDKKERAIYHTILSDMHRVQSILLNLQTLDVASTATALREHFTRDQNVTLGRLREWQQRRPIIYKIAMEDFKSQASTESSA